MVASLDITIATLLLLTFGKVVLCDEDLYSLSELEEETELKCEEWEFTCLDGLKCIPDIQECDGLIDCDDESDEGSHCKFFTCGDGRTINTMFLCDGFSDCNDESDESESKANCTKFECANGEKISSNLLCNEIDDCEDTFRSDECDCVNSFTCANAKCISSSFQCDGIDDCGDNSDEIACDVFTCNDEKTIDSSLKCDGKDDCGDTSDECDCPNRFRCANLRCIEESLKGNGDDDCGDNSDEIDEVTTFATEPGNDVSTVTEPLQTITTRIVKTSPLTTASTPAESGDGDLGAEMFTCDGGKVINTSLVCDGTDDCMDGYRSDECNCSTSFICDNTKCIDDNLTCDGVDDCGDCSDEISCLIPGSDSKMYDMFDCYKGSCIRDVKVCDGFKDCPTGDDEFDCDDYYDATTTTGTTGGLLTTVTKEGVDVTSSVLTSKVTSESDGDEDFVVTKGDQGGRVETDVNVEKETTHTQEKENEASVDVTTVAKVSPRFSSAKPQVKTSAEVDSQTEGRSDATTITSQISLISISLFACLLSHRFA